MLFDLLNTQFGLPAAIWPRYANCFVRQQVPAHTTLLAEGDVASRVYFVEQGCLRGWFNAQGKDVTFQFFFEQQTVSSLESFSSQKPSLFSLETLEPCVLWWLSRADAYQLLRELGAGTQAREQLAGLLLSRVQHYLTHAVAFVRDTPQQRYEHLLAHAPWVVQRVPQHYIASYLGITSVHLSRLKRRIAGY